MVISYSLIQTIYQLHVERHLIIFKKNDLLGGGGYPLRCQVIHSALLVVSTGVELETYAPV